MREHSDDSREAVHLWGRGRRRGEHLHALEVREHSDDSREAVPLDCGGHQGRIAAVIKEGGGGQRRSENCSLLSFVKGGGGGQRRSENCSLLSFDKGGGGGQRRSENCSLLSLAPQCLGRLLG